MGNVFLVEFDKPDAAVTVIRKGSWSFRSFLIIMSILKPGDRSFTLNFEFAEFWVHVMNARSSGSIRRCRIFWHRILVVQSSPS